MKGISNLFSFRKSIEELEWLLSDPADSNSFRSFVAINDDNKVVGHIGYVVSKYACGKLQGTGVHPISWIVSPDCKKGIGLKLMRRVLDIGDFALIIGGTKIAQGLYPFFGFKYKFKVRVFHKILDLSRYFRFSDDAFFKKITGASYFLANFLQKKKSIPCKDKIHLESYREEDLARQRFADGIFYNLQDEERIRWLLNCPLMECHAFTVKKNDNPIGIAISYINKKTFKARLIHLSFLGHDLNLWRKVLSEIEKFLMKKGCSAISTLASHPIYIKGLKKSGYVSNLKSRRPIFVRDQKKILRGIPVKNWHLTFFEADTGYRGV